jgi:hypothetical protein
VGVLRDRLLDHKIATARSEGLVFGPDGSTPFVHGTIRKRARRAWAAANLQSTGLHEARRSAASTMIAAGINAKGDYDLPRALVDPGHI